MDFIVVFLDLVFLGLAMGSGGVARSLRTVRVLKLFKLTRCTRVLSHGARVIAFLEHASPALVDMRRDIARTRLAVAQQDLAKAGGVELVYTLVSMPQRSLRA